MNVHADRSDLLLALDRIARIAKPGPNPILETLTLDAQGDRLTLIGTDLDLQVRSEIPAAVADRGGCTLPAEAFNKLLKRLTNGDTISLGLKGDGRVQIKAKRSQVHFPSLSPDDMPLFLGFDPSHRCELAGKDLAGLMAVAFAAPDDVSQQYLCGVCLHVDADAGLLCAVATDTHVLARATCAAPDGTDGLRRTIIPLKIAGEFVKLGELAGADPVALALSDNMIEASFGGTTLLGKLVEGRYPDYERVLPSVPAPVLQVAADELAQALKRALIIATDRGSGVRAVIENGTMAITTRGSSGAELVEEIDVDFAETRSLSFSAELAGSILAALDNDAVQIEMHETPKGTIWRRPGDDALFCYLMPMRG